MNKIFSTAPDAEVLFFPFESEITYDGKKGKAIITSKTPGVLGVNQISARKDIIELTTNKPKSGVGTFNVTLSSNQNWKRLVHPGAWCMIYISDHRLDDLEKNKYAATENSGFKMLGIVRTVRRQEYLNPETGAKTIRYMIAGEDFQSIFNVPIYVNKNLTTLGEKTGGDMRSAGLITLGLEQLITPNQDPSQIVEKLITNLIGNPGYKNNSINALRGGKHGIPVQIPKQVSKTLLGSNPPNTEFLSTLTLLLQERLFGTGEFQPDLGGVIPAWSIIQTYVHRLLNELYTDILPVEIGGEVRLVPTVVLRAIPFSTYDVKENHAQIFFRDAVGKKGKRVTASRNVQSGRKAKPPRSAKERISHVGDEAHFYVSAYIEENEILAFDLGKSDKERYNFFFISSSMVNAVNKVVETELLKSIYSKGYDKLGDSASIARYGMRPFVSFSNYQIMASARAMNETVADLWINSHLYENGQVTLIGQPGHIPVGTNVEFEERGWVGHVEMVSHRFSVSPEGKKSYYTTLALSRLQLVDGQPIDAVEKLEPFRDWERGITTTNPEAPAFSNELIAAYDKLKGQA